MSLNLAKLNVAPSLKTGSAPSLETRYPPSIKTRYASSRGSTFKSVRIPNEAQININVARTVCLEKLPVKRRVHLKGLLTISTPKHISYLQGDNFVALTLLQLHSVDDAYEIFASKGIRRFRMLTLQDRINFVGEVAPYFNLVESQQLVFIMLSFSHFFYASGPRRISCFPKLLMILLNHDVAFFRDQHKFLHFYLFMLKHLSISTVDELKMNGERDIMKTPTSLQTYIDTIEDLTLNSINTMSINARNTMSNYFNHNNHKCHIVAAYAVMLLDKVLGVNSRINTKNTSGILTEIKYAKGLIHNSSILKGMPNLQGIRPILQEQEVSISFRTNIPWYVINIARMLKGVSSKLFLAQYVLGLPLVPITRKSSVGKHLTTIWYVDKKRGNIVTLYDAVTNSSTHSKSSNGRA